MMEVYQLLPEGTLAQLINNQIIMSPAPSDSHQEVAGEIHAQLHLFVKKNKLGKVRAAPYDVFLNRKNAYQPDILFIASENLHKIKENGLHGAPDLVIEILSPATWRMDKEDKKDEYERSGVKEYWLVDPTNKSSDGFQLLDGEFQSLPSEPGTIPLQLLRFTISF